MFDHDQFLLDGYVNPDIGLQMSTALKVDLVNQTNYDMYLVCSLLANISTGVSLTTSAPPRLVSSTQPPCGRDYAPIWQCLLGVYALDNNNEDSQSSVHRRQPQTSTTMATATEWLPTAGDEDTTTEPPPLAIVEQLLEQNIGTFSRVVEVALIVVVAAGLLSNFVAAAAAVPDIRTPSSWRRLYWSFVGLDQVLLAANIGMLALLPPPLSATGHRDAAASVIASSSTWLMEHLVELNAVGAVVGALQAVQPWFLHTICWHVYQCLVVEREYTARQRRRHPRPQNADSNKEGCVVVDGRLPPLPWFPIWRLVVVAVVGVIFFVASLPPIRLLFFQHVPRHSTVCNAPLVDHWDLVVDQSAARDPFYLSCYCLLYVIVVYLGPALPLLHRNKRVLDELSKRPDDIPTDSERAILCRWSAVVSATASLHLVGNATKTALVCVRLVDCAYALPLGRTTTARMQQCEVAFRYLNVFANVGQLVVRPCCHLPVRLVINDWRMRTDVTRLRSRLRQFVASRLQQLTGGRCGGRDRVERPWVQMLPGVKTDPGRTLADSAKASQEEDDEMDTAVELVVMAGNGVSGPAPVVRFGTSSGSVCV